ncbi:hypothetical protein GCM10029964_034330 [Kibdelosporangium lantanae]
MRVARTWGFVGALGLLLASAVPVASAAGPPALTVLYDNTVYGDFAVIGNTVTECPTVSGRYPVEACHDAQRRVGSGTSAQNNGHPMIWSDVDGVGGTYDSSTSRLTIPSGAHITYAKLTWAGNTGEPDDVPCGAKTVKPAGAPKDQALSFTVNGTPSAVRAVRYTEDSALEHLDSKFYSAYADVTNAFGGVGGPATVTVGNVWTPQGYDCFGGWALTAVWAFDGPTQMAPARRQVVVYDGHVRLTTGDNRTDMSLPAVRFAGGPARVGVTAFEGDWALGGDKFQLNGKNVGGSDNFFVSAADGQVNPAHLNNFSVDARAVDVTADMARAGTSMSFTSGDDAYVVSGLAVSATRPELTITTHMDHDAAHPGDNVTQTTQVTNTGGAPAAAVQVHEDLGCDHQIGDLAAGKAVTVTCTRPARDQDFEAAAVATGQSLVGNKLSVRATASVDVIRPGIAVTTTASPTSVLNGQKVGYAIEMRNTGDTPLSGVTLDDHQVNACDTQVGVLPPGGSKQVTCSVVAGDAGFTNTVTASGTDRLGKVVTAEAHAAFTVVAPKIDFTVTPSSHVARMGEVVTFTAHMRDVSGVSFHGVRVEGVPASCARSVGDLAPGQELVFTCDARITSRLTTALTVYATSGGDSQARQETVYARYSVVVTLVPPNEPVVPAPPVEKTSQEIPTPKPVPVAAGIAGLAVLTTFVRMTVLGAIQRRR